MICRSLIFSLFDCLFSAFTQEVVNGALIVTPNAVMFDPNVSDPLVVENGVDRFGMVTKMEYIVAAAIYRDIHAIECLQHIGCVAIISRTVERNSFYYLTLIFILACRN